MRAPADKQIASGLNAAAYLSFFFQTLASDSFRMTSAPTDGKCLEGNGKIEVQPASGLLKTYSYTLFHGLHPRLLKSLTPSGLYIFRFRNKKIKILKGSNL